MVQILPDFLALVTKTTLCLCNDKIEDRLSAWVTGVGSDYWYLTVSSRVSSGSMDWFFSCRVVFAVNCLVDEPEMG